MFKISHQNNTLLTMRNNLSLKKVIFLALFILTAFASLKAQYNITVGTGTKANGSRVFPCPLQDTFRGARSQYLFRATELKALGMDSGTINSVGFTVIRLNSYFGFVEDFSISMGTTTATTLTANGWIGNLKTVFTPKNISVKTGLNVFQFDSTFDWDGISNLVLEVCNGSNVGTKTSNPSVLQTVLTFNGTRSLGQDATTGTLCGTTATANSDSSRNVRPVTTFNWFPEDFCTGKPVVGTVTANATFLCPSQQLTLTATGGTFKSLIEYQWEKFDFATNTWIQTGPSDNEQSLSLFQDTLNKYRLRAYCGVTDDTSYSNEVTVNTPKVPGGQYYIDKNHTGNVWPLSDTFRTFASTVTAMNCGIKSDVTFNVVPGSGPYNEQLLITGNIINSSTTNTITYNGNGEKISFATTGTSRAVIKLRTTKHITIDSFNIEPTGPNACGVQLQNNADSNLIKRCTITLPTNLTSTATGAGVIVGGLDNNAIGLATNSVCNYNIIQNNKINGGVTGISIAAGVAGENIYTTVKDNQIRNFYNHGIYINGSYNTTVEHNLLSRPVSSSSAATVNGIYLTQLNRTCRIVRNKIHTFFKGQPASTAIFNGINLDNANAGTSPTTPDEFHLANNLIYAPQGLGAQNGVLNTNTSNVQLYHNTISLDDDALNPTAAASTTRCYAQLGTPSSITFVNNLLNISRGGSIAKTCIHINAANTSMFKELSNNNYTNDAALGTLNIIGLWGTNRLTIGEWITASGENTALNFPPVFEQPVVADMDTAKYNPTNAVLDAKGKFIYPLIDLNGATTTRLDIGCYEFVPPPCNPTSLNGKTEIFVNNRKVFSDTTVCENIPVSFKLKITGPTGSLTAYQWEIVDDTVNGVPSNFGVPLVQPDTTFRATASNLGKNCFYYRCKIGCGATFYYSDWKYFCVYPAMVVGSYTIELGSTPSYLPGQAGGNFTSYKAAVDTMRYCGIKGAPGNVIFNVVPLSGPYEEQILIDSVRGISPTRQVVINGNGTIIKFPTTGPSSNTERAVIKLKRALFINLDSITVDASAPTNFGYGIQLVGNSDSNNIRNCSIKASTTQVGVGFAGIVVNAVDNGVNTTGNTLCDVNTFVNNNIDGGYYGMTLVGAAGVNAILNNEIRNNKFTNFYNTGLFVGGTISTSIIGNSFSRPTRSTLMVGTGIALANTANFKNIISKNKIFDFYAAATNNNAGANGIAFTNCDATTNNENIVENNVIYNLGGIGNVYPLINTNSDGVKYYHNSISIQDTTPTTAATAGFFQTGQATNIDFRNNMILVNRAGSANKYALHFATTGTNGSTINSNNNNIFSTSFTGFFGSARRTLADWKQFSSLDANSLAFDPLYIDVNSGNLKPQFYLLNNLAAPNFATDDIENTLRSATPDMGAYEFSPNPCAVPLLTGTALATPTSPLCLEEKINLNLNGHSPLGSIYFQWQDSPDGTSDWKDLGPRLYSPSYDTVSSLRNFYRCIVTCALNGQSTTSNVTNINLDNLLPAGTYTIDSSKPNSIPPYNVGDNFIDFNSAIAAMSCGIKGHIVFDVYPGNNNVYNEQVRMPYIKGSKSTATITFQGYNNNVSGTTLSFSGTSANNYTLRFDSATFVTFKNLNIENTNPTNGRVVEFFNRANNCTVENNSINSPKVKQTTNSNAVVFANLFRGFNIKIKGNTVNNGSMGIFIAGTAATPGNLTGLGIIIDSNFINNSFARGISAEFTNKATISRNIIKMNDSATANNFGIFTNACDSGFVLKRNVVYINNQLNASNGIQVTASRNKRFTGWGIIDGNEIYANTNNTGKIVGLICQNSDSLYVKNNVIAVNSGGNASFGLVNTNHPAGANVFYYNNTVQMNTNDTFSVAAQITQNFAGKFELRNNIFSNIGRGKAIFVSPIGNVTSNYNLLYTNGKNLAHSGNAAANFFAGINQWRKGSFQDKWSVVYPPSFKSNTDLNPDVNNPNVWIMHGRGIQIASNNTDINGVYRPTILTDGAPDLGAYEFYPSVQPPTLPSIPATPTAQTQQTFYFGSDTVMRIKWDINPPSNADVRRFSGVVPPTLNNLPRKDSMYFYTQVDAGVGAVRGDVEVNYLDPWLGSIPKEGLECQLGLGKNNQNQIWNVSPTSRNNRSKKIVYQTDINYFDQFTGLLNQYINCERGCDDTSNAGTEFWTAYPANQLNGGEVHKLYISNPSEEDVEVTIDVPNVVYPGFPINTFIPGGTVGLFTIPNNIGLRKQAGGLWNDAIKITASAPVVAYQHFYGSTSSGATMLMPKCTWGYQYSVLSRHQDWGGFSHSAYFVVASEDSTAISFQNTVASTTGATNETVTLMAGQWYQVLAGSESEDLVGSFIKSVPNNKGICYPFALFSFDTRTLNSIPCGGGGDFCITQNFAQTSWGKRYLTAPMPRSTGCNTKQASLFRVSLSEPNQRVTINGREVYPTLAGPLPNGVYNYNVSPGSRAGSTNIPAYLQFESDSTLEVKSEKRLMVAQFMSGACSGVGDPDQTFISSIEQGVKKISFYRTDSESIDVNTLVLIGSKYSTPSICEIANVGQGCVPLSWDCRYVHNYDTTKMVYIKQWPIAARRQVNVESDSIFTGITYGQGSVESYMYNAGTNIFNFYVPADPPKNVGCLGNDCPTYTCAGTKFFIKARVAEIFPDSIRFFISNIPGISPNNDFVIKQPYGNLITDISTRSNGDTIWTFEIPTEYTISEPGNYTLIMKMWNSALEGCDKSLEWRQTIQVLPAPKISFVTNPLNICEKTNVVFTASNTSQAGINVKDFTWKSSPYGISFNSINTNSINHYYATAGTDTVKLTTKTVDYCVGDTTQLLVINPNPVINLVKDSIHVCQGDTAYIQIANPTTGVMYYVYDDPAVGNLLDSTNGLTPLRVPNVSIDTFYYIEAKSITGCMSEGRKLVKIKVTAKPQPIANPATQQACIGASVTFNVTSLTDTSTVNSWYTSQTGGTPISIGNSFTINPVTGDQTYYLEASTNGCTSVNRFAVNILSFAPPAITLDADTITICSGQNATFSINNPIANTTYNWYTTASGGIPVNGNNYTINNATISSTYYVSATSQLGCNSERKAIQLNVIDKPIVSLVKDSVHVCAGDTAKIQIQNPVNGVTYYLYDALVNGNVIDSTNGLQSFALPNSTADNVYYVEARTASGCVSDSRKMVQVKVTQIPVATATPASQQVCIGSNATFNVTSSTSSNITNNWYNVSLGGTPIATTNSFVVNGVTNSATYYLEASENGCNSASRFAVDVVALVSPSFNLTADTITVCFGNSATFNVSNPNSSDTYNWYTTATGGIATNGTSFTINNATANTTYYVSATNSIGCESPRKSAQLNVIQLPIVSVIQPDSVSLCNNQQHRFVVLTPQSGVTYSWFNSSTGGVSLRDSIAFTTPIMQNANVNYYVEGTDRGCVSANRTLVKVNYLPQLNSTTVTGTDVESNFITFTWQPVTNAIGYSITVSVNGGATTTTNYPASATTHNVNNLNPGDSAVAKVVALGTNSCSNSDSAIGSGKTVPKLSYYPNSFTPNGDGKNDKITICGLSIKSIQYSVWNQWGEKIWESTATTSTNNCYELWDGKHRGVMQPVGVYVYASKIVYLDGKVEEKKGTINLIR